MEQWIERVPVIDWALVVGVLISCAVCGVGNHDSGFSAATELNPHGAGHEILEAVLHLQTPFPLLVGEAGAHLFTFELGVLITCLRDQEFQLIESLEWLLTNEFEVITILLEIDGHILLFFLFVLLMLVVLFIVVFVMLVVVFVTVPMAMCARDAILGVIAGPGRA